MKIVALYPIDGLLAVKTEPEEPPGWILQVRLAPHPEAPGAGLLRGRVVDYVPWGDGITTLAISREEAPVVEVGDVIERLA